jgi:hypothetical protein
MIRLLIVVVILALLLSAVSRMMEKDTPRSPEDTIIGSQLEPLNKAGQFSEDYEDALTDKRKDLDEQIDGG